MKASEENKVHLGNNIKDLMKFFRITQTQLADKLGMQDSLLCNLLQKQDIDDDMLQRIADALGHGVTVELIKNYNHDDTAKLIINNYTQNVESGGTGTLIPNQTHTQNVENGGTGTLIPNPTQNIEDGGTGTLIPNQETTFQEGSTQNNYVAEQAFAYAERNTRLEKLLLYYRMKVEPEAVEKEIESLKKDYKPDQT